MRGEVKAFFCAVLLKSVQLMDLEKASEQVQVRVTSFSVSLEEQCEGFKDSHTNMSELSYTQRTRVNFNTTELHTHTHTQVYELKR